jgi:hypothetical protein
MGKVALAAVMVGAFWECPMGALAVHLLNFLAEQAWSASGLCLYYLGHENSALSLFVGAELDPRGHGLSHLKPRLGKWSGYPGFLVMI